MAFKHGVYIQELSSAISFSVNSDLGVLVAVGTSPIHEATEPNSITILNSASEAVKYLGYSDDWENYTLSEVIYSHFTLYNLKPMVAINVFDPAVHKTEINTVATVAVNTEIELPDTYRDGTLRITSTELVYPEGSSSGSSGSEGSEGSAGSSSAQIEEDAEPEEVIHTLIAGVDYTFEDNTIKITSISNIYDNEIEISYTIADVSKVTKNDIIAGLEKCGEIYTRFSLYPSIIISPKWSEDSEVIAIMRAQCQNNLFKSIALVDIPANVPYNGVASAKTTMNISDSYVIACYPKIALGDREYHLSTQLASLMLQTDMNNGDIPFVSPSNKLLSCDRAVNGSGASVFYTPEQANYLNGLGIVTALNFGGGWKAWGNRTSCYPTNNDVKDNMIPIRRMFNYVANILIMNYWSKIDSAMTRRFIDSAVNSARIWISGLVAAGALVDGTVDFNEEDNPITSLADGQLKFRVTITPPSAAEVITFVQEYDATALTNLFGGE